MRIRIGLLAPLSLIALTLGGCATVRSTAIGGMTFASPEFFTDVGTAAAATPTAKAKCGPALDDDGKPICPAPAAGATKVTTTPSAPSKTYGQPSKRAADDSGIAYFLPRQLALVTAKRSSQSLADKIAALSKAEMALVGAKSDKAEAEAAVAAAEAAIIAEGNQTNDTIRKLLAGRLTAANAALESAGKDADEAKKKRDEAELAVTNARTATDSTTKDYTVALKIELQPPTADPRYGFRIDPLHSILRDDEHKIVVSPAGLLTSTHIVADDRTADVLVELSKFAGALGAAGLAASCNSVPEQISSLVDFADAQSIGRLNEKLRCLNVKLEAPVGQWEAAGQPLAASAAAVDGFVYRTPIDVLVTVNKCAANCDKAGEWFPTEVIALSLPQAGPISYVRQDGGFMTKTSYDLAFKDGILVSYESKRPSDALAVAGTPMRIINGLFEGASKIISLRTGKNNDLAGLTNSELAMLEARYNLQAGSLTGDKKLTDAQIALLQSQTNLQVGSLTNAKQFSDAQIALLLAQNGATAQASNSDLATMLALLRDQAKRDSINKCIGEKMLAGESIAPCLTP